MHALVILILLCLAFPFLARLIGGILTTVFWMILLVGLIAVFSH
jgi:hypothetical protein